LTDHARECIQCILVLVVIALVEKRNMAAAWCNVRLRPATKAALEAFRRKLEQQSIEGRALHWSPVERFGVSIDRAVMTLLERDAEHARRAKRSRAKKGPSQAKTCHKRRQEGEAESPPI